MVDNARSVRVGELLLDAKVISAEKLDDSLELSRTIGQPIGQILIQSGDISKYQLVCAVQVQSLILEGVLSRDDGVQVTAAVCHEGTDFEDALKAVGFAGRSAEGTRLGELLYAARLLSPERIRQALAVSFETAMPLGQTLVRHKFLRPQVVATALTIQRKVRNGQLTRAEAVAQLRGLAGAGNNDEEEVGSTVNVEDTPAKMNAFLLKRLQRLKFGTAKETIERPEELVGSVIAEKYEISGYIGGGGMSLVYLVRHTLLDKVMAMKMMQPRHYGDAEMSKRFVREARAISSIAHPNVVAIHDFGLTAEGMTYLVMDYVHGLTLGKLIRQTGRLSVEEAIPIFMQSARALQHIHSKGIIHRDIKPSNIMLEVQQETPGLVKIVDFGIAKLLDDGDPENHSITKSGELLGSPSYMSPEHCLGRKLDARSDIYSLGCVIFESLTGHPPFSGATAYEIFQRQMNEKPPGLSNYVSNKRLCKGMDALISRCLEKDHQRRIQSMDELVVGLESVLQSGMKTRLFGF